MPVTPARKAMLAKVHLAKKQLGLSDSDYRIVLERHFDVISSKDLSDVQLDRLLKHFESTGWTPKDKDGRPLAHQGGSAPRFEPTVDAERVPYIKKIKAQLTQIGKFEGKFVPWSYANAILERQAGVKYLNWATVDQLIKVIQSLSYRIKQLKDKEQKRAQV
jgi:phage gp16-like protein